jgi:hypothetical protein
MQLLQQVRHVELLELFTTVIAVRTVIIKYNSYHQVQLLSSSTTVIIKYNCYHQVKLLSSSTTVTAATTGTISANLMTLIPHSPFSI